MFLAWDVPVVRLDRRIVETDKLWIRDDIA
jgi:hypothetical protein